MAEFKLGRIRFVWKNVWASSITYYKDDIVRNGGNTYVCIKGHASSANFATDSITFWNKLSDGQEWKGDWNVGTFYKINDVVKYGGNLYITNTAHTSAATTTLGLEDDESLWDQYAEGFDYKTNWTAETRYKENDIVKYNSTVYICITEHTSAANDILGLEADQAKWNEFSSGVSWKGDWTVSVRYVVNDVVKYGGTVYVCNTGHTSSDSSSTGLEGDQSKWDYFHNGIEYKFNWASGTRYKINDVVKQGGGLYICTTYHTSTADFLTDETNWAQFVEGLEFENSWDTSKQYQPGDIATWGGYNYVAVLSNNGLKPTENAASWDLFNSGFSFKGEWAEDSADYEYRTGDVVSIGGYTYLCIADHGTGGPGNGQRPPNATYWDRLNSGIYWKATWADATIYDLGDAVKYGDNSYVCVLTHTSDEVTLQNRPDQDVDGSEWNILAAGAENNVLTTEGDMLYYGGSGPARLPVGTVGQVLTVNTTADAPSWKYLGAINNIYYVETTNGVDSPAPIYGSTLDQPWKTIRYATEQVDKGPLRPDARYLLEINKAFIQDETVEWVEAQIVIGTGIWTGFTNDNIASCRRDMGQIIDALLWDLGHSGNKRTRTAALTYFDNNGDLIAAIADEDEQLVAAINYMETVIDAVISNVAPAVIYGSLNRTTDVTKTEESDAQTTISTLLEIITEAVAAESTTSIPVELNPQNTIFVKTGQFTEVLPIIVPENTAVVGDELRSTRMVAAGSIVSNTDTPYSLNALTRLQAIMADIVTAPGNVTKTTGNSLNPITTHVVGAAAAGTFATELVQQIYDYVDWGVNGATGDSTVPVTYGTNAPNTTTDYTYAVESIEANRAFIVAEILAHIADTYPAYVYSEAKCSRDINAYLDAIKYDLIYTGNYKSLLAAKYYVNAVMGSTLENMFLLRNGTGLRNCSLSGLNGTLSTANSFGTKRPSAGAFVSLDPGWGTADTRAWISNKSPYVQNVSTFGTGCVGMKVDGDLHAGGNDSIVANDFTQILSDGIGAWITNLGRAELVSVFSYYGHIGYLAENGGKIRATNGNSSYGTFGTVAEGVDGTEVPITGTVNNRSFEAIVDSVFTDGNNILALQYANAGNAYTAVGTTINIAGEGYGAAVNSPVVVNGGVFEVRMRNTDVSDPVDGIGDVGGAGYRTAQNASQGGTATQITISNTDVALSAAYTGMAIYITTGTGAGQYGYIDTYNAGTKIATIKKCSDDSAGWDHLTGVAIETTLDTSTNYIIEPRISFTAPPSGLYADTTKARAIIDDEKIVKIVILDPGVGYSVSPTITITDPGNTLEAPTEIRLGNGVLAQPTWTNRGTDYVTAESTITGDGYAPIFQAAEFLQVSNLTQEPLAGSNVTIAGNNQVFKLVAVRSYAGGTAQLQISPDIGIENSPAQGVEITMRIRYSQVRLTGHDFLDIGTGNFADTNYPDAPVNPVNSVNETQEGGGGRVFFTSTDQDGNFRVGDLFSVEQSTGVATLNADAFNISGLQELSLGELGLGGGGATINEFSTDGTFTADSDTIVPTQKAIKTYITSQIGGGAATLNVNSITAGLIQISTDTITTTTGAAININQTVNFNGGVGGSPLAVNYYIGS
tara:strand:- start:763 stop:5565 length:4803 start_codon:yes stop_codon:yes gene_type:complete